jgi:hypothetical protein
MDQFSYLIDRQHRFLLIGIVILIFTTVCLLSGETLQRGRGIVDRAEDPRRFWWIVAFYFLASLFFIGLYLYQNSN